MHVQSRGLRSEKNPPLGTGFFLASNSPSKNLNRGESKNTTPKVHLCEDALQLPTGYDAVWLRLLEGLTEVVGGGTNPSMDLYCALVSITFNGKARATFAALDGNYNKVNMLHQQPNPCRRGVLKLWLQSKPILRQTSSLSWVGTLEPS